jgi:hypothetical protein
MAFASFNSSKTIKGRLQAALYSMRKKRRLALQIPIPPPEPIEIFFGDQTSGGGGNWPAASDRALFRRVTVSTPGGVPAIAKSIRIAFRDLSDTTTNVKALLYTHLTTGGPVGNLLAVSSPVQVRAAGFYTFVLPDTELESGSSFWIGGVSDNFTMYFDSNATPDGIGSHLMNGTLSYASPNSTAPAPSASYANTLAAYLQCEYTP